MKRTAIAAVLVVAMVFGVVAYATAQDEDVAVTAKVNPAFSMTVGTTAIDFTGSNVGSTYSGTSLITVKSNKLWDFSKSEVVDSDLDPVLTESTNVAPGTGKARGVTPITATYDLDLTTDAAYNLDSDTTYTGTFTYTATQQ